MSEKVESATFVDARVNGWSKGSGELIVTNHRVVFVKLFEHQGYSSSIDRMKRGLQNAGSFEIPVQYIRETKFWRKRLTDFLDICYRTTSGEDTLTVSTAPAMSGQGRIILPLEQLGTIAQSIGQLKMTGMAQHASNPVQQDALVCSGCGHENFVESNYCARCGHALNRRDETRLY